MRGASSKGLSCPWVPPSDSLLSLLLGHLEVSSFAPPHPPWSHHRGPKTAEPSDHGLAPLKPRSKIKSFLLYVVYLGNFVIVTES